MPKFVPRQRKHKVRKRLEQDGGNVPVPTSLDSNVVEIPPTGITHEESKRQDMKSALRVERPEISSQKQKRLDKYIVRSISL